MKRILSSTLFLRLAVILMGIPVLALCIIVLPKIGYAAFREVTDGSTLGYMVVGILTLMYISAIPFYVALFQAFKLLTYIDKDIAFSDLSVSALKKIRNCAITISCLYLAALPSIFIIAQWDDAPGLVLIGMVVVGASMVIAVFAAVLKKLLQEAIRIKTENDLTV